MPSKLGVARSNRVWDAKKALSVKLSAFLIYYHLNFKKLFRLFPHSIKLVDTVLTDIVTAELHTVSQ